jgi:molybdopterin-guanine dinucleotide biosynthesis protein
MSVVKHAHHHFDVDAPGRDSWRRPNIEIHHAANVKPFLLSGED